MIERKKPNRAVRVLLAILFFANALSPSFSFAVTTENSSEEQKQEDVIAATGMMIPIPPDVGRGASGAGPALCGDNNIQTQLGEQCDDGNQVNGDGCSFACKIETDPVCGNNQVEADEQCDDGNTDSTDGCANCKTTQVSLTCGNGQIEAPLETCDDGNRTSGDGCSEACAIENLCGDRFVDNGEDCDDGNTISGDGCSANCRVENNNESILCGNGRMDAGEECDDGDTDSLDGCSSGCKIESCPSGFAACGAALSCPLATNCVSVSSCPQPCCQCSPTNCGNGFQDGGEDCDDGNSLSNDGCSASCRREICGDGIIQSNEQCDDGNVTSNDGCSIGCRREVCGDGIIQTNETCDDSNAVGGDGCSSVCQLENAVCPNGRREGIEQCDDGNSNNNDGCSSTCKNEVCGDGIIQTNEQCDDQNTSIGDGCNASCVRECTTPANCNDNNVCNGTETCVNNLCQLGTPLVCNDGLSCTADTCLPGSGCSTSSIIPCPCATDGECRDTNACNGLERCVSGQCQAGNPVSCPATQICQNGNCLCPTGHIFCSASNQCTLPQNCPCNADSECEDGNSCTNNTCNVSTHVCNAPANNSNACNDNNTCTTGDQCSGGQCSGQLQQCPATQMCVNGSGCTCPTGQIFCSASNQCTLPQNCPCNADSECEDGNSCTTNTCNLTTHQCNAPVNNSNACNDSNTCTTGDQCSGGQCSGQIQQCPATQMCVNGSGCTCPTGQIFCSASNQCTTPQNCPCNADSECEDGNSCTNNTCNLTTHQCNIPVNNTNACNDNNACTTGDQCGGGQCSGQVLQCPATQICISGSGCGCPSGQIFCPANNQCTLPQNCPCNSDPECEDGNSCTNNTCNLATRQCNAPLNNSNACNDNNTCTTGDQCSGGQCLGQAQQCPISQVCINGSGCGCGHALILCPANNQCTLPQNCPCNSNAECEDGNSCTNNTCNLTTHQCNAPVNNSNLCNDSNTCTTGDQCSGGQCSGQIQQCPATQMCVNGSGCTCPTGQIFCSASNQCTLPQNCPCNSDSECEDGNLCTNNTCNLATHQCNAPVNNSNACNDSNTCTAGDQCSGGQCSGQAQQCPATQICINGSGCTCPTGQIFCPANNQCTLPQNCPCNSDPECEDGSLCTNNTCNLTTHQCNAPVNNTNSCNDSNTCTTGDQCSGGQCSGQAQQCPATQICINGSGCTCPTGQIFCPANNQCTLPQNCPCNSDPECEDGSLCTNNTCNLATHQCNAPVNNTNACNDSNTCTTGDQCSGGQCSGQAQQCPVTQICVNGSGCTCPTGQIFCPATNQCTLPQNCACNSNAECEDTEICTTITCNMATHQCNPLVYNSLPCTDSNACTVGDQCSNGSCQPGGPQPCPATQICIAPGGSCGCGPGLILCPANNQCTLPQNCPCNSDPECEDADPCRTITCNTTTHQCNPPVNTNSACSDNNSCTIGDQCSGGQCMPGGAMQCPATQICQNGSCGCPTGQIFCQATNQCTPPQNCACSTHQECEDGNLCTDNTCNLTTHQCNPPVSNSSLCSDGNACTLNDQCSNSSCIPGGPLQCPATQTCQNGTCACPAGQILCPANGQCMLPQNCPCNSDPECEDGRVCTNNTCNMATHLCNAPTFNTAPCDDGNACTLGEQCSAGQCVGGGLMQCPAGQTCNNPGGCGCPAGQIICPRLGVCVLPQNCPCNDNTDCDDGNVCTADICSSDGNSTWCSPGSSANCVTLGSTSECNPGLTCQFNMIGVCLCLPPPPTCGSPGALCADSNACCSGFCDMSNPVQAGPGLSLGVCRQCSGGNNHCVNNPTNNAMYVCNGASCVPCQSQTDCWGEYGAAAMVCQGGSCVIPPPTCNNGVINPGEQCGEPGLNPCPNASDQCVNCQCQANFCGNAFVAGTEVCDYLSTPAGPAQQIGCPAGQSCAADCSRCGTSCSGTGPQPACSDGNLCNGAEVCLSGVCQPGTPVQCNAPFVCDPATGSCSCTADPDCNDSNVCTNDRCVNGQCQFGINPCDDGNVCTTDSCNPQAGCTSAPIQGCCQGPGECNDSNPCTADACTGNQCVFTSQCSGNQYCDPNQGCVTPQCNGTLEPGEVCDGTPCPSKDVTWQSGTATQWGQHCWWVPVQSCTNNGCSTTCSTYHVQQCASYPYEVPVYSTRQQDQSCVNCQCEPPPPGCGNGDIEPENGENCETTGANANGCAADKFCNSTDCVCAPKCGNGSIEAPEQCDAGAGNGNSNVCKANCTNNVCGDGAVLTNVEQCDDGNNADGDGCNSSCIRECTSAQVCNDGVSCNGIEDCVNGLCQPGNPIMCPVPGMICDPANGSCACPAGTVFCPAMGTCTQNCSCTTPAECDDSNACTGTELCINFLCQPGTPVQCPGGGICDSQSGQCTTCIGSCDDGNFCNGAETCTNGACQPGTPLQCPSGQICNPASGCQPSVCNDGLVDPATEECDGTACGDTSVTWQSGSHTEWGTRCDPYQACQTFTCGCNTEVHCTTLYNCYSFPYEVPDYSTRPQPQSCVGCQCEPPTPGCGNGDLEPENGENCETAGPQANSCPANQYCNPSNCVCSPNCGNSMLDPGEECDHGATNGAADDDCSAACVHLYCGDGIIQQGLNETCDDGNTNWGDSCGGTCKTEACGDGVIISPEQCDDGNTTSGDNCSATCQAEYCGDGVVQFDLGEQCDDANNDWTDDCGSGCIVTSCGDGIQQNENGEQCDDGGQISGDGCTSRCELENFDCPAGSVCITDAQCAAVGGTPGLSCGPDNSGGGGDPGNPGGGDPGGDPGNLGGGDPGGGDPVPPPSDPGDTGEGTFGGSSGPGGSEGGMGFGAGGG